MGFADIDLCVKHEVLELFWLSSWTILHCFLRVPSSVLVKVTAPPAPPWSPFLELPWASREPTCKGDATPEKKLPHHHLKSLKILLVHHLLLVPLWRHGCCHAGSSRPTDLVICFKDLSPRFPGGAHQMTRRRSVCPHIPIFCWFNHVFHVLSPFFDGFWWLLVNIPILINMPKA